MAKERLFRFKRFAVTHERSAMKVGVDGVLVGAWSDAGSAKSILDAGAGCGLIALMMAQRFPDARILAVETEPEAAAEAAENFSESPWSDRLEILCDDIDNLLGVGKFDYIVSNPPFFDAGVDADESARMAARHVKGLSPLWLAENAPRLLNEGGGVSMIFPTEMLAAVVSTAAAAGFSPSRLTHVRGHAVARRKRALLELRKSPQLTATRDLILETQPGEPTEDYHRLCRDFYLKF